MEKRDRLLIGIAFVAGFVCLPDISFGADFLDSLGTALGGIASAAGGGIFGLLGAGVSAGVKYFQRKQEMEFEQKKWAYEEKMTRLTADLRMKQLNEETESEMKLIGQQGRWDGLGKSITADTAITNVSVWVNNIRGLYRPFLTTLLIGVDVLMFVFLVSDFVKFGQGIQGSILIQVLGQTASIALLQYMIYSHVFAATTSVVWWFGDRAFAPPGMKNK